MVRIPYRNNGIVAIALRLQCINGSADLVRHTLAASACHRNTRPEIMTLLCGRCPRTVNTDTGGAGGSPDEGPRRRAGPSRRRVRFTAAQLRNLTCSLGSHARVATMPLSLVAARRKLAKLVRVRGLYEAWSAACRITYPTFATIGLVRPASVGLWSASEDRLCA
jgi:hypothetical protein